MHVNTEQPNQAELNLDPGDVAFFPLRFLRGRDFGLTVIPPCPAGSPLARIVHGCYWLARLRADGEGRKVTLLGPEVVGRFVGIQVNPGESYLVDCEFLAALALKQGGEIQTKVGQLFSPTMWAIGHPLPVIVHGPAHIVLYGEGLRREEAACDSEYIPAQLAALDARVPFEAMALNPDNGLLSHLVNALGSRSRCRLLKAGTAVVAPINHDRRSALRLATSFATHAFFALLFFYLLRL